MLTFLFSPLVHHVRELYMPYYLHWCTSLMMKNLKERIREIGGTFKTRAIRTANSVLANDVPEFKIKTCKGLGTPNDCGADKIHQRLDGRKWRTKCNRCRRKWTA